jgi:integrase
MECRKCKAEIPEGSAFCNVCGARQGEPARRGRRGNKQGTAVKRGNTWSAVWIEKYFTDEQGKLHCVRRWKGGFKTKTAALTYAANPPAKEETVSATLRDYYNTWLKSDYLDLSKSKQTAYKIAWAKIADIADTKIGSLTIERLQDTVDGAADTYYPARDIRTLLSHLYKRAVAEGTARTNLADFIRLPPLNEKEMKPFETEEIKKLWKAYGEGDNFVGYLLLMIYSGMMPGELFTLKKDMIDFDKREIIGCGLKTKKRKETPIVFPEIIEPVLRELCEQSNSKIGNVLCINRDNFYAQYHETLKRVGVRDLPPYSCRHTTATALAEGNIAPSIIQEIMRHTKFTTTQRYIHPDTEFSHNAINTLGAQNQP